jgi:iron complex outermembrane receptor protein
MPAISAYRHRLIGISAALLFTSVALPALAQAAGDSALGEIVVTAQRRAQSVQDIASVVQAVSSDTLARANVTDPSRLQYVVPSLRMSGLGSTANIYMRGVGQGSGTPFSDAKISTSIDGVYLPKYLFAAGQLYDVDRVEAVFGPQGTLYGRNATAGAINTITREPTFQFGGSASLQVGNYDTLNMTGVVNVPVSDKFALRGSFSSARHDGYLSNGLNDEDTIGWRLRALYQPNDRLKILGTAAYVRQKYQFAWSLPVRADGSFIDRDDPWYFPAGDPNGYDTDYDASLAYAEITYKLTDDITLTWIPAYARASWSVKSVLNGTAFFNILKPWQHTEEVRLNGTSGRLTWVAGAYVYDGATETPLSAFLVPTGPGRYLGAGEPIDMDYLNFRSYALYGQGTYAVTDKLRLTLGARASWDRKWGLQSTGSQNYVGTVLPLNVRTSGPPVIAYTAHEDLKSDNVDWRVGFEYDLAADSMLFANISTGYLQGGFTTGPTAATPSNIFKPEKVTAYEIGIKNRFLDRRLLLNADAFYYDYQDLQVQALNGLARAEYFNAPESEVYGADLEVRFLPTPNDNIGLSLNYLEARILEFTAPGTTRSFAGYDLGMSPRFSGSLDYAHTFDLPSGASLVAAADMRFMTKQWTDFLHPVGGLQPAREIYNASLTYNEPDGRWSVMAFVNNITEEPIFGHGTSTWRGFPDPEGKGFAYNVIGLGAPRTYGVRINATF